jgi:hypothetical protein
LWALDVKTAFLHGTFPEGIEQFVRAPSGVPRPYFPDKVFKLGKCVYGHPAAGNRYHAHHNEVYVLPQDPPRRLQLHREWNINSC